MAKHYTNTEELELIADAIRQKGGTNAQLTFPNEFVSAIENLPTSSGTVATGNDVVFYDYDGTIVTSYSASAFAQLSQLPANPTHTGLVAQGWNWSLADAKTYVAKYGKLNIGQMYITASGATEIDVVMQEGRLKPTLTICINGTVTVDWGDGTTPDTVTGTSLSTRQTVPHTYAQVGTYTISISAEGNNQYSFYNSNLRKLLQKNATGSEDIIYANTIQHVRIGSNAEIMDSAFYYCHSLASITIPNSVTSIGAIAFYGCYSLTSITIPNGVTSIADNAFYGCYSLSNVTIPDSVTSIGTNAFYLCCSLSNVTIPNDVTSIGGGAFYSCYSLSNIIIPNDVTSIGSMTFYNCSSLLNVTIPDRVTSIGNSVFYNCYSLSNITIPDNVASIGTTVFYNCHSLSNVTIPDSVASIGSGVFSGCNSLLNVTIPDSVESIGSSAFANCISLSNVTIPDDVTSIGANAFKNCYGVAEYHILPTTPPTAGTTIFASIPSDCVIYVPSASLETYKTTTGWSDYASHMQGE